MHEGDEMLDYVRDVTYRCLVHEAFRDTEREADGEAMVANWRLYMPLLWNLGHTNYVWVTHRLLIIIKLNQTNVYDDENGDSNDF